MLQNFEIYLPTDNHVACKKKWISKKKTVSPKKTLDTVLKKQHYIICELCVKPLSASVALI